MIKIINDADHALAIKILSRLMEATSEEDIIKLKIISSEIESYEAVRWPRERASEEEIVLYMVEQNS